MRLKDWASFILRLVAKAHLEFLTTCSYRPTRLERSAAGYHFKIQQIIYIYFTIIFCINYNQNCNKNLENSLKKLKWYKQTTWMMRSDSWRMLSSLNGAFKHSVKIIFSSSAPTTPPRYKSTELLIACPEYPEFHWVPLLAHTHHISPLMTPDPSDMCQHFNKTTYESSITNRKGCIHHQ